MLIVSPGVAADWTWVNQGLATTEDVDGGIRLIGVDEAAAFDYHMLVKGGVPATNWKATIGLRYAMKYDATFPMFGLVARESGTGKFIDFSFAQFPAIALQYQAFDSPVARNSVIFATPASQLIAAPVYLQIEDDGVNLNWRISQDGRSFVTWRSSARAAFCVPDQYGFGICDYGAFAILNVFHAQLET